VANKSVSLSFDVDWATDTEIADTVEILEKGNARATFFATHRTEVLANLDRSRFEIALHPNFIPLLEGNPREQGVTFREILVEAQGMYPEAVGLRSHGLVHSGPLQAFAAEHGFLYESNSFVPAFVAPFRDWDRIIRIPTYWSDYRELLVGTPFRADGLELHGSITSILAFHPVHVFVNSVTPAHFNAARSKRGDVPALLACRHTGAEKGIRDFLVDMLRRVRDEDIELVTMREVAERHVTLHGESVSVQPSVG